MKVMLIHYHSGQGGGAESHVKDLRYALELLGHEIVVEYTHPDKAWQRFKPDVMHFHTVHCGTMGIGVLKWAQDRGIPHCISLHDYWPFCGPRMLLSHHDQSCSAVEGLCDGKCDGHPQPKELADLVNGTPTVTFNEYSAAIFERHGIRVDAVIPHGINTDFFKPDPEKRIKGRIMTSSAWAEWPTKGMHILRKALETAKLEAKLVCHVTREQVRDELQKSSIFVLPSCYEETYGLCLLEAMACGCACVASDVCGARAQIDHGTDGLLFPNRNAETLAETLRWLVADDFVAQELGKDARATVERRNTLQDMAECYTVFYEELIMAEEKKKNKKRIDVVIDAPCAIARSTAGGIIIDRPKKEEEAGAPKQAER